MTQNRQRCAVLCGDPCFLERDTNQTQGNAKDAAVVRGQLPKRQLPGTFRLFDRGLPCEVLQQSPGLPRDQLRFSVSECPGKAKQRFVFFEAINPLHVDHLPWEPFSASHIQSTFRHCSVARGVKVRSRLLPQNFRCARLHTSRCLGALASLLSPIRVRISARASGVTQKN